MSDKLKAVFGFINTWKVLIPIIAAVIMYFTPDFVDMVIKDILKVLGMNEYVLKDTSEETKNK